MRLLQNGAVSAAQRRAFLQAVGSAGLLAAIGRNRAMAAAAPDYKALVCINLSGGNDGENTLIRYDSAGFNAYAAARPPASGIHLPQASLLPVQPASIATPFGFNPECAPLRDLFNQKRLAVVANVGVLAQPVTKAGLQSSGAPRPANLFSHSDQTSATQSGDVRLIDRTGWGGRIADRLDAANAGALFPPLITLRGLSTFTAGRNTVPLAVPESAFFQIGYTAPNQLQYDALRDAALRDILRQTRSNTYDIAAQLYSEEGMAASSVVVPMVTNPASLVPAFFNGQFSSIATQLKSVAQIIEGRAQTDLKRQVFFVEQGAYDTHGNQILEQGALLADLSRAMASFLDAMTALGISENVTAFTLSEFGRTWKPAANRGTDHGWGSYAFVAGGAVKGGDIFGKLPVQALDGPDDFGKDGRWIPTTSIEQYCATMVRWFGMSEGDLPYIFPNIASFASTNLDFMR